MLHRMESDMLKAARVNVEVLPDPDDLVNSGKF